jgi:hypothetical protein
VELRRGDAGTWAGNEELLACCFGASHIMHTLWRPLRSTIVGIRSLDSLFVF